MPDPTLQDALGAAQKARQLSHDHQRLHRDADPADAAIAKAGAELRRLADEATAKHDEVQRTVRAAVATKRRTDQLADDAGLQARLREEAQARRDAAAALGSPPRRSRGLR